jgi:hypothetical protein
MKFDMRTDHTMSGDTELSRIGISLPKNLLDKFDEILALRGYSSRSEGIRDSYEITSLTTSGYQT